MEKTDKTLLRLSQRSTAANTNYRIGGCLAASCHMCHQRLVSSQAFIYTYEFIHHPSSSLSIEMWTYGLISVASIVCRLKLITPREKRSKGESFRCENWSLLNNVFIELEWRCFTYDNNANNVKQYRMSIRARVHEREKKKRKTKSGKWA